MAKNIIKEIFIMLLLCVAIILILAVVFYEYNPINKTVPSTLSYKMPDKVSDEVKNELETTLITEEEQVIKTYELTESELNLYESVNYKPGKANPFETYSETTDNTVNNSSTNTNNNTTNTNKTNTNSTGHFFEDGSTK